MGDGNNVCHELILGATKLGMAISVAAPAGHEPNPLILKSAMRDAQKANSPVPVVTADPHAGRGRRRRHLHRRVDLDGAGGRECGARLAAFQGFMVSSEMMAAARPEAVFMHCLPAHRGEEVAAEVIDGPQSVVFDEAENRLHVQKALLVTLMGEGPETRPIRRSRSRTRRS